MSFTRFYDDPARIQQQLKEHTFVGRYQLDTPGPGINLALQEDPQMRMQRWGANLRTNTVNLESDLIGLTRTLQRDPLSNEYTKHAAASTMPSYPMAQPFVEESRASHPAWTYRDLEHPRWELPWINPQANLEKRFHDNIQTRILEKDYYVPRVSIMTGCQDVDPTKVEYYLTGRSMCAGGLAPQ
jgi:hypothetical protein